MIEYCLGFKSTRKPTHSFSYPYSLLGLCYFVKFRESTRCGRIPETIPPVLDAGNVALSFANDTNDLAPH
jgi:hypothetical protein